MIGELESEILEILKKKEQATASDVLEILGHRRNVAYTTVSTTLDRLYKKHLLGRKALRGPGGIKYLFYLGGNETLKSKIVENTLSRLTGAFGETAYSAIYKHLETLPKEDLDRLKKQVDKAKVRKTT